MEACAAKEEFNKFFDYELILNQAPCGVGIFQIGTGIPVFLNDEYFRITGYTREEYVAIQKEQMKKLVYAEDMTVSEQSFMDFTQHGEASGYEYRVVRKDGEIRWVKLNLDEIEVEGEKYAFAFIVDFTKEREAYERLSTVSENVQSSISLLKITKTGQELIYANPAFYRMIGMEPGEYEKDVLGYGSSFVSKEDHKRIEDAVKTAMESGQPGILEHRFCPADGRVLWLSRRYIAIKQEQPGTWLLISVVTDITEQKLAEIKNLVEKQRFQMVIDEMNAAVFEWNLQESSFYCSEAYHNYAISQASTDDILNNRGPADVAHPDDYPVMLQFFADIESGTERAEVTLRLKMIDGSFRWCRMLALFLKDEKGQPWRTTGIILDINEERERNFMLGSLLNELPGGVAIFKYRDKLECQYYSDGFAKLSGRTRAELDELLEKGELFETAIASSDVDAFLREMRARVSKGEPINMTYRYLIKDKGIGWLHMTATKFREEDGCPVYYCIFTNPTDETTLYRNIVEDSVTGIFVAERKTRRILYMNEKMGKLFGVPRERLKLRIENSDPLPEEYVVLGEEDVAGLREDAYTEFHVVWKDKLRLGVNARALNWNGIDAYIMYFTDETVEYEQQIKLQTLINNVPAGIGIYEIRDGKLAKVYINDAYYDMLGVERQSGRQYDGYNAINAVFPEDRKNVLFHIKRMIEGTDKTTLQCRFLTGSGEWKWFNLAVSVIERRENYLQVYIAFSDCDEMMRIQSELQANRAILDAALTSAQVIAWKYDFKNNVVTDSGTFGTEYQMSKTIADVPNVFFEDGWIHEDSIEDMRWLCAHAGDGKKVQKDIRCRAKTKDGYIWKQVIFSPVFDKKGNCIEAVGTAVDITEQKEREQHYEEQLRLKKIAAQDSLATAIFNLTENSITEVDAPSPELSYIRQYSTPNEMLLGIHQSTTIGEDEQFNQVCNTAAMLQTFSGGVNHVEIRHHLKNSSRWVQSNFDMIQNPYTGNVEAITTLRDVSDAVRAELVVNRLLAVDYETILTFDRKTGAASTFRKDKLDGMMQNLFTMLKNPDSVQKGIEEFYNQYAVPKDRERAIRENSPAHITQMLEKMPIYTILFSLQEEDRISHKRALYAYLDDSRDIVLCAVQDVTDTYEQEEKQKNELALALKAAERANQSKRDFLARMSHDMRTPMNGIIGITELSVEETEPEVLKRNLAKVKESGEYLLGLINDTLDFQKLESGKLALHYQIIHTATVLNNVVDMIRPVAEEKGVELKIVNRNMDLERYMRMDPVRIKQIVFNLLSNAVKFTPRDGTVTMELWCTSREGMIAHTCIQVSDTGIGMSKEFIEHDLYKPFSQEQREISTQYAGTGLGLSIVHSLVTMIGGRIEVESQLGKGTTFTLYLDFEGVSEEEVQRAQQEDKRKEFVLTEELTGKKILLIEDHPLNAQIAIKLLEKAGCEVTWMDNGEKGVREFVSSELETYDAILMDIRMPVMTGLEAAAAIRQLNRPDAASIPIVAMTANAYEDDVQKSMAAGMNAHIVKPIRPDVVYETLVNLMVPGLTTNQKPEK